MSTCCCPVCQRKSNRLIAEAYDIEYFTSQDKYQYFLCDACQTIFINPQPLGRLAQIYPSDYYANTAQDNDSLLTSIKEWFDRRMFKRVTSTIDGMQLSALDVGGGSGWMLNNLKRIDRRFGYTAVVDFNEYSRELAARNGHEYFCSRIEMFESDKKFDLILLLNLIEHVEDPARVLKIVANLLTPNGRVIIKTPNTDTLDRRIFLKHYWGGLHCPRHWVLFNAQNFSALAHEQGLSVADLWYTQGAPQWTSSIFGTLSLKS